MGNLARLVSLFLSLSALAGCRGVFSPNAQTPSGGVSSLEFGHTGNGARDYCAPMPVDAGFGNGMLISAWTRIAKPVLPGNHRGNQNVLFIDGTNWQLVCLDGNISYNADGIARYNANFMLGDTSTLYIGDFCTYYSSPAEGRTAAEANGWVWVAWQVVVEPGAAMTLRQWLKFGVEGEVYPAGYWDDTDGPGEETVLPGTTSVEGWDVPATFAPGPIRFFRLGDDNTWSGVNTPSNSYLCRVRVYAMTGKPTIAQLDAMARSSAPDPSAWGDWALSWENGAPLLADRSGNSHGLSIESGGALFEGAAFP